MKPAAPFQHYLDLGAAAHVDLLHANNRSGVHIVEDDSFNGWTPVGTFPKDQALTIAAGYEENETPAYVGQQAFRLYDRRCIENVTFIGSAYVDLDTYGTPYAGQSFSEVWAAIRSQFPDLPAPTIAGSSGRGLQLVWCFKQGKPKDFYPHWQVIEDTLVNALEVYGADRKAKDLARVLRLSHSYNRKSGTRADLKQTGEPVTYEALQRWCNGYRKTQRKAGLDRTRPDRNPPGDAQGRTEGRRSNVSALPTKNAYTLHAARMDDYKALARLRGGRFTDCRRTVIYLYACAAAWFCHDQDTLINEVEAFTARYVDKGDRYKPQHIQEIINRQAEALQGKTRQFAGRDYDPRYRHRNQTIIDQLGITETEQHLLSIIIGKAEKRARDRLRKAAQRRKAGIQTRSAYLAKKATAAQERRQMALDLAHQGLTRGQIASQMGITKRSVFNYLQGVKQ